MLPRPSVPCTDHAKSLWLLPCEKFRLRMRESEEEPPLHESEVQGPFFITSPSAERGSFAVPSCPATSGVDHPRRWGQPRLANGTALRASGYTEGLGSLARYTGTSGVFPRTWPQRGNRLIREEERSLPRTSEMAGLSSFGQYKRMPCSWLTEIGKQGPSGNTASCQSLCLKD